MNGHLPNGVVFNAYPDSIDRDLAGIVRMLARPEFADAFSLFYVLPTVFNSDLDRGFSVIDYELNPELVSTADLDALRELGVELMFDLVLNHLSVGSPQFLDLVANGDDSPFIDFFIDWNAFWDGEGERSDEGFVVPNEEHLAQLFTRKPGLPILEVAFPDGSSRFYWNTFYQQVDIVDGERTYLGQMDLNAESELVWDFYRDTIARLADLGATVLRLDAFAYLHKEVGSSNFFNKPGTWEYLDRLRSIADESGVTLLPEIHSQYGTKIHEELSDRDFPVYDFFLPGLVLDALDTQQSTDLRRWIKELIDRDIQTVNMLGCHDGIPVIDLRGGDTADAVGLLSDSRIDEIIDRLVDRGGRIKNLFGPDGEAVSYYQVNTTFFSALGESEMRLRLARAIQLFVPGTPQIWYLDLFAGVNDYAAADRGGSGGHKEINRTNLTAADIEAGLRRSVVLDQLEMIRLRNTACAFRGALEIVDTEPSRLTLRWHNGDDSATLDADLTTGAFSVSHVEAGDEMVLRFD